MQASKDKGQAKTSPRRPAKRGPSTKRFARKLANLALEKKARNICMMDLRKLTTMTDFFVICTGDSEPQVKAITAHIEDKMKAEGVRAWNKEGTDSLQWVLLDYVDVVVHVFQPETREFYGLESFWGDAKIERIDTEPDSDPSDLDFKTEIQ